MASKWICCQIGAREHYSVARALYRTQRLGTLYTDYWASGFTRYLASRAPLHAVRVLASRYHPELTCARLRSWNFLSLAWEAASRYRWTRGHPHGRYPAFIEVGSRFSTRVRDSLKARSDIDTNTIVFAYDTSALEVFQWCSKNGVKCVLNQMDPNRVEVDLVREEEGRWPGWQSQSVTVPESYFERREQEWALADKILVNSEFSRSALIQQGVPTSKLVVIPLCYEPEATLTVRSSSRIKFSPARPLRVLWLGQVILRKGIQYVIEAARKLANTQFDIVGPVGISQKVLELAPKNMIFHGRATRDQAGRWYRQADVFILPTLSDGFALTQLEAMSYGLPVVATLCCGKAVSHGVDGLIIPARDSDSLVNALGRYLCEPALLESHQAAALQKSRLFSVDHLSNNLLSLESSLLGDQRNR